MHARHIPDQLLHGRTTGAPPRSGRRRRPVAAAVAAVVMSLTGCAGLDDSGSDVAPGGVGNGADDVAGVDEPLLEIRRSGGFMPFGWDFATVSELTVYTDGRAVVHGPQIEIFPPPVLPNLLVLELADADLEALVTAARDAGLLGEGPLDYGQPPVADAPTTFVTLHVDAREHAHAAEALGLLDGAESTVGGDDAAPDAPAPEELPGDDGLMMGLTPEQRDARAALAAFITQAHELVGSAGEGEPYLIDAFAVMARPAAGDVPADDVAPAEPTEEGAAGSSVPAPDDELQRQVLTWPLEVPLTQAYDCLVVEGEDARVLREALAGASFTVLVEQGGVRYDAFFRPLLPHDEGCADL